MASTQRLTRISKFLSLVLRHEPETIGLSLDDAGWLDTDALLKGCAKAGRPLSRAELELVVEQNDKRRFVIDGKRIRANQGHSRAAVLELAPSLPPQQLYHGSAERFLESILREGLQRKNRQHVHLSLDVQTALKVGQRHGKPVILTVAAAQMHTHRLQFFLSENNVWLTASVPSQYLQVTQS